MEVSDLRETEILAHLEDILASPAFCTSQRSSQFLRYVVESALAGEKDRLKERVIGERIFGQACRLRYRPGLHRTREGQ